VESTVTTGTVPASLRDAASSIDEALGRYLAGRDLPENLREAIGYSVLGGGKRLRPALVLLSSEAVGGGRTPAFGAAMALELIHCFSLVHDDLPAMDDDDLRRGRPTLHVHAGEAMAILAGDAMVSLAFGCIAEDPALADREHCRGPLVRELAAATTGMIAGQVYDTLGGFEDDTPPRRRLDLIHQHKTAALIRAACRMGAICGNATPEGLAGLTSYGEAIGLMFQIVDDLLDVTQSAEHIGKATGKDLPAGKLTFPGLLGIEASREEARRLKQVASESLVAFGPAADPLRELCSYLAVRTR
jgi:geranylgeranyl diphosphate synthase type II